MLALQYSLGKGYCTTSQPVLALGSGVRLDVRIIGDPIPRRET